MSILNDSPRDESRKGNPFVGILAPEDTDAEERRDAPALSGELLDQLLTNAHVEGQRLGRSRALAQAQEQFPRIWDEGYQKGWGAGGEETRTAIAEANRQNIGTPISHALASILAVKARTGSPALKLECEAAAGQLAQAYQVVTGQLPDGFSFEVVDVD